MNFYLFGMSPHAILKPLIKTFLIMKLTVLFIVITFLQVSANSYAQKITLSEKNVSLGSVLSKIESQTGYLFWYENKLLDKTANINVNIKNATLEETLKSCLQGQNLTYSIINRTIVLEQKKVVLKKEIRGTVIDTVGALPGVSISVKGKTGIGTQTDLNGKYFLEVPDDEVVLVFSMIGYESQEIPVRGKEVINVTLKAAANKLNDVVVVAFGKQKKISVVGSVTTVRPDDLKVPSSNLTTTLAGRLSGVIGYQRSGEPGADNADFFIRGVNSFGYKVDPLILIDGLEVSKADFARLNTEDISTFSVMKDATATALYGSRGANGVIVVTTKEGKEGKVKIDFRMDNTISKSTKDVDLADPVTYMKLHNEAVATRDPLGKLPYSQEKVNNTIPGSGSFFYPSTDWRDELMRSYIMNQKAHLNVSGGGNIARYYVAGAFTQDNGMLKVTGNNNFNNNINLKNYQLRSNVNVNLTPSSELIVRLSGIFDDYNGPIGGGTATYRNIMRTNPVLFPAFYPKNDAYSHLEHPLFGNYEDGTYLNPYAEMVKGYKDYSQSSMSASLQLNQKLDFLTKGLSLNILGSTNRYSYFDVSRNYNPYYFQIAPGSYNRRTGEYEYQMINPLGGTEYLNYAEGPKNVSSSFDLQSILTYNQTFNKHSIGGALVFLMQNKLQGNAGNLQESLPYRNLGLSGRLTYGYDNRYFAEYAFGYNGSERFYETERFGFFPSAGIAWAVSNEKFWNPDFFISNLKFRASYGLIGNDQIGGASDRFFYLSDVNMNDPAKRAYFGEENLYLRNGISVKRFDNKDITWESSTKFNLGLDIGLLKNSVEIVADYFTEYRSNILMNRASIPTTMGLSAIPRANVGEASSRGFDMSVNVNHSFNQNLWITGMGNFTFSKSSYEVYEEPIYPEKYLSRIGYSLGQQWGYIAERLFYDDAEVRNSPEQSFGTRSAMAGDIKYKDVNNDGQITELDRVPIGHPTTPEIVYGFGVSTGYKNFDLSVFFQGSAQSSFWIDPAATAPFVSYKYPGETNNNKLQNQLLKAFADDHWSEEHQNAYALWPRLDNENNSNNNQINTWFMRNGAFLRLKQLEMGFTLPKKSIVSKIGIQKLRVYASGTNLFLWSAFKLWDIEQAGKGLEYPLQKIYNLGVQISL